MNQFIGIIPPHGAKKRTFVFDPSSPYAKGKHEYLFEHNFDTTDLIIQCFTIDGRMVQPAKLEIIDVNNIRIVFSVPQTGRCIVIA